MAEHEPRNVEWKRLRRGVCHVVDGRRFVTATHHVDERLPHDAAGPPVVGNERRDLQPTRRRDRGGQRYCLAQEDAPLWLTESRGGGKAAAEHLFALRAIERVHDSSEMQQRGGLHHRLGAIRLGEGCCHQRRDCERVDVRFERPPARKAMAPGEIELRVGEPRCRIRFAQFLDQTFGLLAQPVEVGMFREAHDAPSFLREGSLSAARVRTRARNEGSWRPTTGG